MTHVYPREAQYACLWGIPNPVCLWAFSSLEDDCGSNESSRMYVHHSSDVDVSFQNLLPKPSQIMIQAKPVVPVASQPRPFPHVNLCTQPAIDQAPCIATRTRSSRWLALRRGRCLLLLLLLILQSLSRFALGSILQRLLVALLYS